MIEYVGVVFVFFVDYIVELEEMIVGVFEGWFVVVVGIYF